MSIQSMDALSDSGVVRVNELCNEFEAAWATDQRITIESLIVAVSDEQRPVLLVELALLEAELRGNEGQQVGINEYLKRFPDIGKENLQELAAETSSADGTVTGNTGGRLRTQPGDRLGRYVLGEVLGSGGFGVVYKAWDEELHRDVAIKLPTRNQHISRSQITSFLTEARTLAALDHPGIVPVYDAGDAGNGAGYVVSKLISGVQLSAFFERMRGQWLVLARVIADIADALHHAHLAGVYHRDIKPANVLVDDDARVFVTDFGLALRDNEPTGTGRLVGTPAYMSPEQARGESHRIDGRSDVFSLGVVLYETLCGRKPFRGDTKTVLAAIKHHEPRPPRQIDDKVPRELERVCLKALSKRISERYSTAADMAAELRTWIEGTTDIKVGSPPASDSRDNVHAASSESLVFDVVPRGLRSFDEEDAGFFLRLIPGPRGGAGLPDSIRFWKSRIETTDPNRTFTTGVLYGPSGAGKSSLLCAGLLPVLSDHVTPIFVEATATTTEKRIRSELIRSQSSSIPESGDLSEIIASMRKAAGSSGRKHLIVLDQFEQWLHASPDLAESELVSGLRQCDGLHVQCLLLIRDDFWLSLSRFMQAIEVDLVPGRNVAVFDLFDINHARRVLRLFGQAFGQLPSGSNTPTEKQLEFVDESVDRLAVDGRVVPVHLSLFAEMVKGREWTPETLDRIGGMKGLGVTFLEESLSSSTAMPQHRVHLNAARRVLHLLLPERGDNIKGRVRSYDDLLQVSGYSSEEQFRGLLKVLDADLRLITPADTRATESIAKPNDFVRDYQLTHDYLVPSLREWLYQKQRETRRGRAQLKLAERAAEWKERPVGRNLLSFAECVQLGLLTKSTARNVAETQLVRSSARRHISRGLLVSSVAVVALLIGRSVYQSARVAEAGTIVEKIEAAAIQELTPLLRGIRGRDEIVPLLVAAKEKATAQSNDSRRLNLSLALLERGFHDTDYFVRTLVEAELRDIPPLARLMRPDSKEIELRLWKIVNHEAETYPRPERLKAAFALGELSPQQTRRAKWQAVSQRIVPSLMQQIHQEPQLADSWILALKPLAESLSPTAIAIAHAAEEPEVARAAAKTSAAWNRDSPSNLVSLASGLSPDAFLACRETLASNADEIVGPLVERVRRRLPQRAADESIEDYTQRHGVAAETRTRTVAVLFQLGAREPAWELLRRDDADPVARDHLILKLSLYGADRETFLEKLHESTSPRNTASLIRVLSWYPHSLRQQAADQRLDAELLRRFKSDPDGLVHSLSEWLLLWHRNLVSVQRARLAAAETPVDDASWYVDSGQTMVIVSGKKTSDTDPGNERYAISSREISVGTFQWLAGSLTTEDKKPGVGDIAKPQVGLTWYEAARFCNLLSERAGIPRDQWCYLPNEANQYAAGMQIAPNSVAREGYRLPTEAEWLYACRGASTEPLPWGAESILAHLYAWRKRDGSGVFPVGIKRPNEVGLFDMLGNAAEWCHDGPGPDTGRVDDETAFALRGGSVRNSAMELSMIPRQVVAADDRIEYAGFRVVRSIDR